LQVKRKICKIIRVSYVNSDICNNFVHVMSKIIGIIAAAVLVIAAFVAFKNQQAYGKEIDNFRSAQTEKKDTIQRLEDQQKRFKEAEESKADFTLKLVETGKKLATAIRDYDDLKKEVASLEESHSIKEEQIATAENILKELPEPDDLIPKLKRLSNQLVEAEEGIANEEDRVAKLTQRNQDANQKVQSLSQVIDGYSTGRSLMSLKTSISAIYSGWGFVILAGGDNEGVVPGSMLNVMRAGEVIAKLRVTAVEAGRSAADIVVDSMSTDTKLRAGDEVVAEEKQEQSSNELSLLTR